MQKESSSIAIHALVHDDERLRRLKGAALNAVVQSIMATDTNYPIDADETGFRNYERRVRRIAYAQLLKQEQAEQKAMMTRVEFDRRVEACNAASAFSKAVLTEARKALAQPPQQDIRLTAAEAHGYNFDEEFEENEEDDPHARDLEDDVEGETAPVQGHVMTLDEEGDSDPQHEDTIPYIETARAFMNVMLNNTLAETKQWKDRDISERVCAECVDDPTMSDEQKQHVYPSAKHLERHLDSTVHSIYEQLRRQWVKDGPQYQGRFWCRYCAELDGKDPEERQSFTGVPDVVKHVQASRPDQELSGRRPDGHDDLKAADGWYLDEFYGTISKGAEQQRVDKAAKRLKVVGTALDEYLDFGPTTTAQLPRLERDGVVYDEPASTFATRGGIVTGEVLPATARSGIVYGRPRELVRMADGTRHWREADSTEYEVRDGMKFESGPGADA